MKLRIIVLLGYWLVALAVVSVFAGYGHGSFAPLAVFTSWAGFVTKAVAELLNFKENGLIFEGLIINLFLFAIYYLGLMKLSSKLTMKANGTLYIIPAGLHLCGGLAFFMISDKDGLLPSGILYPEIPYLNASENSFYLTSYVVSISLVLLWLRLDWGLAKKDFNNRSHSKQGEGP